MTIQKHLDEFEKTYECTEDNFFALGNIKSYFKKALIKVRAEQKEADARIVENVMIDDKSKITISEIKEYLSHKIRNQPNE